MGVAGGELPAEIWRTFLTDAAEPDGPGKSPEQIVADAPADPQCDHRACAETYQSFDAADCTYQPYGGGPRVRCEKGDAPLQPVVTTAEDTAPQPERCDRPACARAYRSFRGAECTYQPPEGGPRRVCKKVDATPTQPTQLPREGDGTDYQSLRARFFAEPPD
jgi:hypothetical protein